MKNLEKLKIKLPSIAEAALIVSPVNRRYLTDFESTNGYLLETLGQTYFFTDFRYVEIARERLEDCIVIEYKDLYPEINRILTDRQIKNLAIEASFITLSEYQSISKKLDAELVTDGSLDQLLIDLRSKKEPAEIALIQKAGQIAEKAFDYITGIIKPGMTEKQLAKKLDIFMLENGADSISFDTIVLAGANTSKPHGTPSDYMIKRGDFVLMDFGAVVDGYHSDMTRTLAVGEITEEQRLIYETVNQAGLMSIQAIREGVKASDIDKIARDYIDLSGYVGCFGHSLGHSLGLEIHEKPSLAPNCHTELEKGMILTVEPGIYINGVCGVRIEDMILVDKAGCTNLTKAGRELIIL